MEEAERLCDRLAIVDHGNIIATDRPKTLIAQHFKEEAIEFELDQNVDEEVFRQMAGVTNAQMENGKMTIYSSEVPITISALMELAKQRNIQLTNLYVRRATLEDVFLKLTGRKIRE